MLESGENYEGCAVRVLGLGNVLVGDDAFGPFVVRTLLAAWDAPDGVEIHDVGTPGLDLAPHIAGCDTIIVVDSASMQDAPPGTVRVYRMEELLARGPSPRSNPHQPSLVDTLYFLQALDTAPREVVLVAAKPLRYDTGAPLSEPLRDAVPLAIQAVLTELRRLGHPLTRRETAGHADIWWEDGPRRDRSRLLSAV